MKRLKLFSIIAAAVVSVSLYTSPIFASEATTNVNLQLANVETNLSTNALKATFKVTNTGSESINLADVKLRYYYTADSDKDQDFHCYDASIDNPYESLTANVKGTFVKMDSPVYEADTYLEISFNTDSGTLEAGKTVSIQSNVNKKDWTNYDQSNDYSFNDREKVVAVVNDEVIWGTVPEDGSEVTDSKLSKTSDSFELTAPADIQVGMELNGNTLTKIQNGDKTLSEGVDYTIDGTTVTISKDYLSTLEVGSSSFIFDFSSGVDPKLTVNVTDSDVTKDLVAGIGQIDASLGETITLPVTLTGVPEAGIADFAYRIKYDPSLVEVVGIEAGDAITDPDTNFVSEVYPDKKIISVLFIDSALNDEGTIKTAGVLTNIKLKIKDDAPIGIVPIEFNDDDHSFYDINGNELKVEFASGSININ